jgi:ribosomal protein L11 methyltransferase
MEQIEITIDLNGVDEYTADLLPYWLEQIGFEGFTILSEGLLAYIQPARYNRETLKDMLKTHDLPDDCFSEILLPDINWNAEWEKHFEPVLIDEKCFIRATFHTTTKAYPFEIVIEPKMSFGTGHHATTSLMIREILRCDMKDKAVLDAGCGTGILAILSEKAGARRVTAIDIDEWSYRNALENASINNCSKITFLTGNAGDLKDVSYDIILANINLNILKAGVKTFSDLLRPKGCLIMSGILSNDILSLKNETEQYDLTFQYSDILDNWAVITFEKK